MVKVLARKSLFVLCGVVLLYLPATAWAVPLEDAVPQTTTPQKPILEAPRLSRDVVSPGKELLVSIGHDTVILEPNTPYEIFLDNISLGVYTSDPNGQLFVQVKIPASTTPGQHTLSTEGPHIVRTYKTIQVI